MFASARSCPNLWNTMASAMVALSLVLLWGRPVLAAPPADQASAEQDETLQRNPDSKLNFLSEAEYRRLDRTQPITVPTQVVMASEFPQRLATSCKTLDDLDARTWAVGAEVDLDAVLAGAGESDLFERLQRLSSKSSITEVRTAARELAAIGAHLGLLCDHVAGYDGGLTVAEVELLRAIFDDDASNLTMLVEVLDKAADQLLDVLTAPDNGFEQAKEAFVTAVDLGSPGTPQSIGALSSLGSAGSTAFTGLTQFLINRAKEEAIAFVREELSTALCSADPGLFIPKTCKVLRTTDASMSLSAMGSALNAALLADLEWMPDRLLVLIGQRAPEASYAATTLRVLLALARDARAHGDPLDFIVSLHEINEIDCEQGSPAPGSSDAACAETMALLRMASTLAYAIVSQRRDDSDYFKSLGVAFALEQHADELPESVRARLQVMLPEAGWTADGHLRFSPVHLSKIHRIIVESVVIVQSLQSRIAGLGGFDNQPNTQDILATAAVAAVALANIGLDIIDLIEEARSQRGGAATVSAAEVAPSPTALLASPATTPATTPTTVAAPTTTLPETLVKLRPLLEDASDGFALVEGISGGDLSESLEGTFELIVSMLARHGGETAKSKSAELERQLDNLRRYLPMFIEIANAKSSDEVAAALQAAFPAGGYKLKYRQPAVSINAFLGAYGGALYGSALNADATTTRGLVNGEFSLYAPVGVHITGPVGRHRKRPWALGGLISVIDVGGMTTSKWVIEDSTTLDTSSGGTETTAVGEPGNFNFAGLVAPGGYFTINVAKAPFALGIGASYSPFAQQMTVTTFDSNGDQTGTSQSYLGTLRFGAFLAVDITLVAFGLGGRK